MNNLTKLALTAVLSLAFFSTASAYEKNSAEDWAISVPNMTYTPGRVISKPAKVQKKSAQKKAAKKPWQNLEKVFAKCMFATPMDKWEEKAAWWAKKIPIVKKVYEEDGKNDINIHHVNYFLSEECGFKKIENLAQL